MGLVQVVQNLNPILYWRGFVPSTGIQKDFSGNGQHSTASGGTIGRTVCNLPGDPIYGWTALDAGAFFRLGSPIAGFVAATGTVITFVEIKDFTGGGLRGFFDTAPSAVGALRLYTTNDFVTSMNRDVGGEAGPSTFNASGWAKHPLSRPRFRMIGFHWGGVAPLGGAGQIVVTMDTTIISDAHTWSITPVTTNFDWGSINGSSLRGGSKFHSVMVFNRCLTQQELRDIYKAAWTPIRRNKGF